MHDVLIRKIDSREFVVGVIGLGYVGLPLAIHFAENGFYAHGFDIDPHKIQSLNQGDSYIRHIDSHSVRSNIRSGRFTAYSDFDRLVECDAIIITVPTPLSMNQEPDLSFIESTARSISNHLREEQIVILESTTYPGTTEDVLKPILEKSGLAAGVDFLLAYSPEREDPNNKEYNTGNIPKIVGGLTPDCLSVAIHLYKQITTEIVPVSSIRAAESTKLFENVFRSVNIALVNELKMSFMKMDLDVWEIIAAASTKPFGFMPFYPGPGLGGHCIPIDPFYLAWIAQKNGASARLIELSGEINTSMPGFVINRVADVLGTFNKSIEGARILVLGLAYKPDVDDTRESPSLYLIHGLEQKGAQVDYHDPFIAEIPQLRSPLFANLIGRKSVPDVSDSYDLVLISTAHDVYRQIDFSSYRIPIVDTRNLLTGESKWYFKA